MEALNKFGKYSLGSSAVRISRSRCGIIASPEKHADNGYFFLFKFRLGSKGIKRGTAFNRAFKRGFRCAGINFNVPRCRVAVISKIQSLARQRACKLFGKLCSVPAICFLYPPLTVLIQNRLHIAFSFAVTIYAVMPCRKTDTYFARIACVYF